MSGRLKNGIEKKYYCYSIIISTIIPTVKQSLLN